MPKEKAEKPPDLSLFPRGIVDALARRGFSIIKLLGQGSFGSAFLVRSSADGERYVVKTVDTSGMKSAEKKAAVAEVSVLRKISKHPCIVNYFGSFLDDPFLFIVLEYCDGGDLSDAIRKAKSKGRFFAEERILLWLSQLLSALSFCHSNLVLHRDLKAENVFLHGKDKVLKLGDFGIARVLSSERSLASTVVGTPFNLSPQVVEGLPYDQKSDVSCSEMP
jgi:NIMA (never in mitosis gene a)-related kinase 1/4/5